MSIIHSCLRMEVRFFFFIIDIEMTVAYAYDIECVYVCEFRGRNSFKGKECKTWKNSIILKNGKTVICRYRTGGKSRNFLDLG